MRRVFIANCTDKQVIVALASPVVVMGLGPTPRYRMQHVSIPRGGACDVCATLMVDFDAARAAVSNSPEAARFERLGYIRTDVHDEVAPEAAPVTASAGKPHIPRVLDEDAEIPLPETIEPITAVEPEPAQSPAAVVVGGDAPSWQPAMSWPKTKLVEYALANGIDFNPGDSKVQIFRRIVDHG